MDESNAAGHLFSGAGPVSGGAGEPAGIEQRRLPAPAHEQVFRALAGPERPVHSTIAQFRKEHPEALCGLENVRWEGSLLCTAHDLLKLAGRRAAAMATPG